MKIKSAKTTEKEFVTTVTTTEKSTIRVELFDADLNAWQLYMHFSTIEEAQTWVTDQKNWSCDFFSKARIVKRFERIFDTVWAEIDLV